MPPEYWQTCDSRQGGVVIDIGESGICVCSPIDMYVGGELGIRIFFCLGHLFDGFQALVRIIGKDVCSDGGWDLYKYELEFIEMSDQDRLKLRNLLDIRPGKNMYS